MHDAIGVASGIAGASFSLAAACSRWMAMSPAKSMFWIKRFSLVVLGLLVFSGAALSQVPGNQPGWWLDQQNTVATSKQKSDKVIVAPHVKIIVRESVRKRHTFLRPHVHVHYRLIRHHLRHHRHHYHRHCFALFPWCWR